MQREALVTATGVVFWRELCVPNSNRPHPTPECTRSSPSPVVVPPALHAFQGKEMVKEVRMRKPDARTRHRRRRTRGTKTVQIRTCATPQLTVADVVRARADPTADGCGSEQEGVPRKSRSSSVEWEEGFEGTGLEMEDMAVGVSCMR